jgi:hypothetical protein
LNSLVIPDSSELILFVDTDDARVINMVSEYTDDCKFDVKVCISGNPAPSEVRISQRRDRIVANHEKIKEGISGEYVFGLEDDTIFPPDTLERLYKVIQREDVGFIQGVQVGRWGVRMIGAWRVNNIEDPTKIITYPYVKVDKVGEYLEGIDAGGFYCFMTKASLYKEANFRHEAECLGPDVLFGLDLRRKGYKCLINWSLVCGHNVKNDILYPDEKVRQVEYNKFSDKWVLINDHKA